jgi:sugar lactone lactonase YvrE
MLRKWFANTAIFQPTKTTHDVVLTQNMRTTFLAIQKREKSMKLSTTTFPLFVGYLLLLFQQSCSALYSSADHVFIRGAPLVGGSQGLFFDNDNNLIVAQVYGRTITTLNAETGAILEQLGFEESVAFVDDVVVGPDDTLYWTDSFYFQTIFSRPTGGPSIPLMPIGSVPFANSITLSDDGTRLFYAQCWNPEPENGVYELNLESNTSTTIIKGVFGCSSNAMDYLDNALYTPRPYEGRIVKIDLAAAADNNNNDNITIIISNVTTNWGGAPQALKFDSTGRLLYATNSALGQVVRIDLANPDTDNNREVIAEFPPGWIDNLAFDQDNRLYISSTSDATIVEILLSSSASSGKQQQTQRVVSPGEGFAIAMGIAYLNNTIFTVDPGALVGINVDTGDKVMTIRANLGIDPGSIAQPTSVTVWGDNLVLMSISSGVLEVFDPFTATSKLSTLFDGPLDAHPFRGDLLVTEINTGSVVRASGSDLGNREIIANTTAPAFLAGDDDGNVYLTDVAEKTVYQIIANGTILAKPVVVATGFTAPEGIALLRGEQALLVVDGGSETLEKVDLMTGKVETLATDLGFFPAIPYFEFGFPNDVTVDDRGAIYVNADRVNVIYKFPSYDESPADDTTSAAAESIAFRPTVAAILFQALAMLFVVFG